MLSVGAYITTSRNEMKYRFLPWKSLWKNTDNYGVVVPYLPYVLYVYETCKFSSSPCSLLENR